MSKTTAGWALFIVALGMMASLMAPEVAKLSTWGSVFSPPFTALVMAHFGSVITGFVAGKIIPIERDATTRTREGDTVGAAK